MLYNKKIPKNAVKDWQAHKSLVDWNNLHSDIWHKICEMFVSLWFPYPPMSSYQHLSYTHSACELQKVPRNSSLAVVALEQCGLSIFPWRLNRLKMFPWYFFQHVSFLTMVNRLKFAIQRFPEDRWTTYPKKSQLDLSSECQVLSTKSWWDACAEKTFRCAPVGISQINDSVIVKHFAKLRILSNPATFTTKLNYWQHSPQSITRTVFV